jgi:hypothetical protein
MTDIEIGPRPGAEVDGTTGNDRSGTSGPPAPIVPLNDAAAIYEALADQIRGTAAGWSDTALAELERGLLRRYGPVLGGRPPVRRLIRLAARRDTV